MLVIANATQKGGVGKTTTTINLAACLQQMGYSVLLIDVDPQGSLTDALGITDEKERNLFTELSKEIRGESGAQSEKTSLADAIITTACGLQLIPSSIELAWAELELVSAYGREQMFSWMLDKMKMRFDFIFFDCPPSAGLLTVNALVASDYILMPLQAEYLSQKAVRIFMYHLNTIRKLNKKLKVLGIVFTKYDDRKTMNKEVREKMKAEFGEKVFTSSIRSNIQLAQAQEAGLDIFSYNKRSHGAEDYTELTKEFLLKLKT